MTTTEYHVTKVGKSGVYGHPTTRCDEGGCAGGSEFHLGSAGVGEAGPVQVGEIVTVVDAATTTENVTLEQVEQLRAEAAAAGDAEMVALCDRAKLALYDARRGANAAPRDANEVDLIKVVEAIRSAEAMR